MSNEQTEGSQCLLDYYILLSLARKHNNNNIPLLSLYFLVTATLSLSLSFIR